MKKIVYLASIATTSLLFATSYNKVKLVEVTHLNTKAPQVHTTHWGYTGHQAPQYWGDINPKYKMCKEGVNQAPINISKDITVKVKHLPKIGFKYYANAKEVVNNGHSIQVNVDNYSSIDIDGKHFYLKQFYFHTPSENEIDGRSFPFEAHFVHAAKDGSLAVIGVLFELGEENPTLKAIWDKMPQEADNKTALTLTSKQIEALLPKSRDYYSFNGSLTTPPCSEGVRWMVLKQYKTISKEQVEQFLSVMHHENNRPVQDINARKVLR
jgi:carbonic anhydrase